MSTSNQRQRELAQQLRASIPRYTFSVERRVCFTSDDYSPMHNNFSSTSREFAGSNDYWQSNLYAVRSWARAGADIGFISAGATRELFIGTPISRDGRTMDAIYAVVRHWRGTSMESVLSFAKAVSHLGFKDEFLEIVRGGVTGLRSFLLGLLDFGVNPTYVIDQALPDGDTEACVVFVEGSGVARENTNAQNAEMPTYLDISYTDYVFSFDLLLFYASIYNWDNMLIHLHGDRGQITWTELVDFFREYPRARGERHHPAVMQWFQFCARWDLSTAGPMPDPRAEGRRYPLDRRKMYELYLKVQRYMS